MTVEWIAADWGTSNLRVWLFGSDGELIDRATSDRGMGSLAPEAFEGALLELVGKHLPQGRRTPVIACGMVGARQGWNEAAYASVPCAVPGIAQATAAPASDPRLDVRILPGVMQARPADVMRGEETQIGGFLASNPGFDGVICLPGTHTKWVHVSAGEIVSFRTVMTGELFALLSKQSVLRHSLSGEGWDDTAFAEAVADAMMSPQYLTSRLFSLRSEALLSGTGADVARARLSGLLLGVELAGTREYWLGRDIAVVGAPKLTGLYVAALKGQGVAARQTDGGEMTLAGLKAAYREMKGTRR